MFNFDKTYALESKAYPGVVVTLRRIGPQKRAEIEMSLAAVRAQERQIADSQRAALKRLIESLDGCKKDAEGKVIESSLSPEAVEASIEFDNADRDFRALHRGKIDPAFVKVAVKSMTEITYEGQPATAEMLCEYGPDGLFDEIVDAIDRNLKISEKQAENLKSPTTSVAQEDGQAKTTTADDATKTASTSNETAESTTPST